MMPGVQHRRLLARSFSHILPSRFFMLKLIVFKTEKFFSRTMSKLFVSALSKTFLFRKESDTCWICFIVSTWENVIVLLCCWCCCPSCTAVHVHVVVHLPARPSSAHLQLSWLFSMFVFMLGPGPGLSV